MNREGDVGSERTASIPERSVRGEDTQSLVPLTLDLDLPDRDSDATVNVYDDATVNVGDCAANGGDGNTAAPDVEDDLTVNIGGSSPKVRSPAPESSAEDSAEIVQESADVTVVDVPQSASERTVVDVNAQLHTAPEAAAPELSVPEPSVLESSRLRSRQRRGQRRRQ